MQRIVDDIRVSSDDVERGVIKLDPEKVGSRNIEIRIGRKRDADGNVDLKAKPTVRVEAPTVMEANGYSHELTPMEARLRNLNYMSKVYIRFDVYEDGVEVDMPESDRWIHVGDLPMMVKSAGCNLNRQVMQRSMERPLTDKEYEDQLIMQKEDPREPGGYFIIGGTERVLITLEDLAPNRVMVEYNEKYGAAVEVAKVFSQKDGYRALTLVEKKKDGTIMVSVPVASGSIPLVALMKALGMEKDEEIFETIVSDEVMANIVYANIEASFDKKTYAPNGFHTTEDAILFLERNFAAGQAKEYRTKKVESILDRSLLPHLGDSQDDRMKKAIFLGRIARTVLELSFGKRQEDDKDHYANKRLKLSGDLMEDLFRTSFSALMKDLEYQLERNWGRKKTDMNIASSIRPDLLTHKLLHALATGNWVGGRAGVSQLLDRTSNLSAMSHLRRITSSLTRSQPHFEARDLHPTQWGRLCPSETPEGQNCGLVKNAALIIDVSEGFSDTEVKWMLRGLDLETVKSGSGARVYVNGDLVGTHSDPAKLVSDIRERRRVGLISNEINIRYDDEMGEVIINCDEGRLRRPLLIIKNGRLAITRKHIEGIREGRIRWEDLFREGFIEWLDAEEEEDALILVDAYDLPKRCPCCNHALSRMDADWMNVGQDGDAVLRCRWCGKDFTMPSKIRPDHTHMEVDPMVIIGVAAGIVPYPEHNSAPRITMGAGMGKQALGVPGPLPIEAVALRRQHLRDLPGGQIRRIVFLQVADDVPALPSEGIFVSQSRKNRAVAGDHNQIVLRRLKPALVDLLALDHARGVFELVVFALVQHDGVGVVEPRQFHVLLVAHLDDGERGIGDLANAALRQGAHDGVHAILHGHAADAHRGQDAGRERGQDIRLDAAAQAVREHANGGVLVGREHDAVAAELFSGFIEADIARIDVQITHMLTRRPEWLP